MDWKRNSQHVYEELRESVKTEGEIKECLSDHEIKPETDRVQNNHRGTECPPLPKPNILAENVSAPLLEPVLELLCSPALGSEHLHKLKEPVKFPEPEAQLTTVTAPVSSLAPIPAPPPPLPPPLHKEGNLKPQKQRTKAFHWDVIMQDKVLYLKYCTKDIKTRAV